MRSQPARYKRTFAVPPFGVQLANAEELASLLIKWREAHSTVVDEVVTLIAADENTHALVLCKRVIGISRNDGMTRVKLQCGHDLQIGLSDAEHEAFAIRWVKDVHARSFMSWLKWGWCSHFLFNALQQHDDGVKFLQFRRPCSDCAGLWIVCCNGVK